MAGGCILVATGTFTREELWQNEDLDLARVNSTRRVSLWSTCNVVGTVDESPSLQVNVEVWLPSAKRNSVTFDSRTLIDCSKRNRYATGQGCLIKIAILLVIFVDLLGRNSKVGASVLLLVSLGKTLYSTPHVIQLWIIKSKLQCYKTAIHIHLIMILTVAYTSEIAIKRQH